MITNATAVPVEYVVPPTAPFCFSLAAYRARVDRNANETFPGSGCVYGVLSYWLEGVTAVQSIPRTVREAAYMDGAKPLSVMRHIMMPLSLQGVRVSVFINLLGALRAFDIIYVLTGGGPVRSTETVGYFMYRESMTQFKLGYGAAATVVLLVAVLVISLPAIIQRTAGAK